MQDQEADNKKLEKERVEEGKGKPLAKKKKDLVPKENIGKKENILKNNFGEINISPEVLATIISRIVSNISGVTGLVTHSKSGFGTLLGVKEIEEGIKVDLMEGKSISTCISVIVDYGSVIIDLAKKIQTVVKSEVENKTGLFVKSVDVNVMGVEMSGKHGRIKQDNKVEK